MLYAKIVFDLAIDGPFDYLVPKDLEKKIKVGSRVWVNLRAQRLLGFVVQLNHKTNIMNLKEILVVIDEHPLLDKKTLFLTKEFASYYCCSWGQAIATVLPVVLRKGKTVKTIASGSSEDNRSMAVYEDAGNRIELIHDPDNTSRWDRYIEEIKIAVQSKHSVIIVLPDIHSIIKTKEVIKRRFDCPVYALYRKQAKEAEEWLKIKDEVSIVIGTRSVIFAPAQNLGLVILDEEDDPVYKQDQVPHYHVRQIAFMRVKIEGAKLILGAVTPSLESFYLAKEGKIKYTVSARHKVYPEVKIFDMRSLLFAFKKKRKIFSDYLINTISEVLVSKGKVLLFVNRKGFATFAICQTCGKSLKCPRCNISLVFHYRENILGCHHCNFKIPVPDICPDCNSGYIKYSGIGTEKVESELQRIFPQARIDRLDNYQGDILPAADIFISTQHIFKLGTFYFDLIGVLAIDNSLNRVDMRSTEKTYKLVSCLAGMTEKKMIIQTALPDHHCFKALLENKPNIFYDRELEERKSLKFPPYRHLCLVKLRGKIESRVAQLTESLFNKLNSENKNKNINFLSSGISYPAKLRGNFYRQILINTKDCFILSKFLKIQLKDLRHSGIIVTVDMDPI